MIAKLDSGNLHLHKVGIALDRNKLPIAKFLGEVLVLKFDNTCIHKAEHVAQSLQSNTKVMTLEGKVACVFDGA